MREDWVECTFEDVFFTTSGGTPNRQKSEYYNGNIPWVKSGELKSNIITETEEYITELAVEKSSAKLFPKGTLLLALYGATIGKTAILGIDATTNQAICGIFETPYVFTKYTYYYLQNRKEHLIKLGTGGAQPNISQNIVKGLNFPLPPLPEQRAIVKKIEALFSSLDAGISDLKKAQEQLKIYRQAVLKKAFEGELTKHLVWEKKRFEDCTLNFNGKRVPLNKSTREKRQGEYRYYGATEIVDYIDDYIFDGTYLLIGEDGANLLSKSKPLAFIAEGKFWVNNHAHIVQNCDFIMLEYLCLYFNNLNISEFVTGTAQPKLNKANLNKIPIRYPVGIENQALIVKEIETRLSVCDAVEKQIQDSLSQAEALRQSILKKAFEGRLLSEEELNLCKQAPDYEPASALLAKIKAEKESNKPVKKKTTKKN